MGMKRVGEPASPPKREETSQRQHRSLGRRETCHPISKLDRTAPDRSRDHVEPDRAKSVRNQQMLAPIRGPHHHRNRPEALKIERLIATRWAGFDTKHIRMDLGAPDRARQRDGDVWRLESMQAPALGHLARFGRMSTAIRPKCPFRRRPIAWVPPEPFPGEERTVGREQRRVSRRSPPVRQMSFALGHAREQGRFDAGSLFTRTGELHPRS